MNLDDIRDLVRSASGRNLYRSNDLYNGVDYCFTQANEDTLIITVYKDDSFHVEYRKRRTKNLDFVSWMKEQVK